MSDTIRMNITIEFTDKRKSAKGNSWRNEGVDWKCTAYDFDQYCIGESQRGNALTLVEAVRRALAQAKYFMEHYTDRLVLNDPENYEE